MRIHMLIVGVLEQVSVQLMQQYSLATNLITLMEEEYNLK